ncbi:hypothetical protein LX36DRAFT_303230 [Colletotrichum falcatum]|nr:hypothetical protein LX36DRAFT_303230 [Colletotrichum falcatum]
MINASNTGTRSGKLAGFFSVGRRPLHPPFPQPPYALVSNRVFRIFFSDGGFSRRPPTQTHVAGLVRCPVRGEGGRRETLWAGFFFAAVSILFV